MGRFETALDRYGRSMRVRRRRIPREGRCRPDLNLLVGGDDVCSIV